MTSFDTLSKNTRYLHPDSHFLTSSYNTAAHRRQQYKLADKHFVSTLSVDDCGAAGNAPAPLGTTNLSLGVGAFDKRTRRGSMSPSRRRSSAGIGGLFKGGGTAAGVTAAAARRKSSTPNIAQMLRRNFNPGLLLKYGEDQSSPFTDVKEAFDCLDEDGDGLISVDDLAHFMTIAGMGHTSQSELIEMITEQDSDGDGFLSYADFTRVLNMDLFEGDQDTEVIRDAFRQFDQEGLGFILEEEMKQLLCAMGAEPLTEEELREVMIESEVSDGNISYETFVSRIKSATKKNKDKTFDREKSFEQA